MSKLKSFWTKFKSIKHIEIIIAVVVGVVICLVYLLFVTSSKNDNSQENSTEDYTSAVEYVDWLENKLCNVLSKIDGVGDVNVIVTLQCGFTYEYAKDTETKTTTSGGAETTIKTETVILVSNEPVVVKEIYPVIKGVVVVAEGAENFSIKMNILSAVETVLEVERENITILA
jgi:stage III sporulation protein AG